MNSVHSSATRPLARRLALEDVAPTTATFSRLRSPLWLCLLLALITRAWLIYHAHGLVGSDEAQIGIQALRILKGEHPLYPYGQPVLGSLSAYLIAPFFAVFGPTDWALRAPSLLLSLVLVCLTWLLARALAENAKLEQSARRRFQTCAALLAALPPLYDGVVQMRVWGGYSETFVFGLLIMYCAVRLAQRWSQGIGLGESVLRWLGLGLVAGVGYRVNPLIELPIQIAVLWLIGSAIALLLASWRDGPTSQTPGNLGRSWLTAIYAPVAALIGFAPALYWGYRNHWQNIKYLLHPEQYPAVQNAYMSANYLTSTGQVQAMTKNYLTCDASRVASGLLPNIPGGQDSALTQLLHPQTFALLACDVVFAIMLICSAGAVVLFLLSYAISNLAFIRKLLTLPLLLCLGVSITFCFTNITTMYQAQYTCDADRTGSYAALLLLALPFMVAAVLTLIGIGGDQARARQQYLPMANGGQAHRTDRTTAPLTTIVTRTILLIVAVLYVGTQSIIYANATSENYFRSSSCQTTLVHADQVVDFLRQNQLHALWSDRQIGNILTLKTGASVVTADPRVLTNQLQDLIPDYTKAVKSANQAAIAFLIPSKNNLTDKLTILDAEHVKYNTARFTVDQGTDLAIIMPVDYTFQPIEATTLITGEPTC